MKWRRNDFIKLLILFSLVKSATIKLCFAKRLTLESLSS